MTRSDQVVGFTILPRAPQLANWLTGANDHDGSRWPGGLLTSDVGLTSHKCAVFGHCDPPSLRTTGHRRKAAGLLPVTRPRLSLSSTANSTSNATGKLFLDRLNPTVLTSANTLHVSAPLPSPEDIACRLEEVVRGRLPELIRTPNVRGPEGPKGFRASGCRPI